MNGNESAFPIIEQRRSDGEITAWHQPGLTIRQYIMIEMAKGLVSRQDSMLFNDHELAERAGRLTDALMEA